MSHMCFSTVGNCRSLYSRLLSLRFLTTTSALSMPIKVGEKLPSVVLYENSPANKVTTSELFSKGKSIIFGIPGAFTPTCSNSHAPGFIENADALKAKGIKTIACVSVNDPFVMEAWGKSLSADGKVRMFADTNGEFTKKIDMELDLTDALGSIRSKRYAMVVNDGVIEVLNAEPGGRGLSCSAAAEVIKLLFSMLVTDGVVTAVNVEPDGTGLTCSAAQDLLNVV